MTSHFSYLWNSPRGRYFLIGSRVGDYTIWDSLADMAVIIEDDDECDEIIARMMKAGVPTLLSIPEGPHQCGGSG